MERVPSRLRIFLWACLLLALIASRIPAQDSSLLLVLLHDEGQLAFIDPASGKIVARLPTGLGPHELVASRDGRAAHALNSGIPPDRPGSSVTAFDLARRAVRATFELERCTTPHGIALSRDARLLWVTCPPEQRLLELDASTGKLLREWNTRQEGGWMLAAARDGHKLYVPNLEGKSITVIDRRDGGVHVIPLEGGAMAIDVSPATGEVWVGAEDRVVAVDGESNKLLGTRLQVERPVRLQFTADGKQVWVTTRTGLSVFDATSAALLQSIDLEGSPKGLLLAPDGQAYVALRGGGQVVVVDVATRRILRRLETPSPEGLAWIP